LCVPTTTREAWSRVWRRAAHSGGLPTGAAPYLPQPSPAPGGVLLKYTRDGAVCTTSYHGANTHCKHTPKVHTVVGRVRGFLHTCAQDLWHKPRSTSTATPASGLVEPSRRAAPGTSVKAQHRGGASYGEGR